MRFSVYFAVYLRSIFRLKIGFLGAGARIVRTALALETWTFTMTAAAEMVAVGEEAVDLPEGLAV